MSNNQTSKERNANTLVASRMSLMFEIAKEEAEKSPCPEYCDDEEWNDLVQWAAGTPREQQDKIIDRVLRNERKGRGPHTKKIIQKAFLFAAMEAKK